MLDEILKLLEIAEENADDNLLIVKGINSIAYVDYEMNLCLIEMVDNKIIFNSEEKSIDEIKEILDIC